MNRKAGWPTPADLQFYQSCGTGRIGTHLICIRVHVNIKIFTSMSSYNIPNQNNRVMTQDQAHQNKLFPRPARKYGRTGCADAVYVCACTGTSLRACVGRIYKMSRSLNVERVKNAV